MQCPMDCSHCVGCGEKCFQVFTERLLVATAHCLCWFERDHCCAGKLKLFGVFLISFPNPANLLVLGDEAELISYSAKNKYEIRTFYGFIFIRPCEVSFWFHL